MEKENKKARDDSRKGYNDIVKALVKFIRKRDPRYKAHLAQQASSSQSKSTSNEANQQDTAAALRRAQASENYVEQEWQKVDSRHLHVDLEWAVAEGGDDEEWECVVCNKTFRSEAAWDSHERSKKHLKEVERLQRQMLKEDEAFGLEGEAGEDLEPENAVDGEESAATDAKGTPEPPRSMTPSVRSQSEVPETPEENSELPTREVSPESDQPKGKKQKKGSRSKKGTLEPMSKTERRAVRRNQQQFGLDGEVPELNGASEGQPEEAEGEAASQVPELSKRDKRRAKQAKKAEDAATPNKDIRCHVCAETFQSKTKLFNHINETGHALAEPATAAQKSRQKGKKK